jgi:hypothetical protein
MPTAEEAAAQNLAYRQANNLPTDAASMGVSSTLVSNAQSLLAQQDAIREEALRVEAFSQPRTDYQTPSAAFLAINAQYQQQHGNTVSSGGTYQQSGYQPTPANPYDPNTAAGIAWDINRGGGTVGANLSAKASSQGYTPTYYQTSDRVTVPTRDLSYAASIGVLIPEKSVYYPTEQHGQVKTQIFGDTYLNPASGEMTTFTPVYDQSGKVRNIQNISGGAGAYGAQSGEMTFSPQGAIILNQDRSINKAQSPSNYQDIFANPDKYSRGGEAYYGKIMPLDSNHLLNTIQTVTPTYGSQDWWNQSIKDRATPDTKMDTGSFGNQIGIMMYPKGTNAANYMIKGSENYVKGTTYPSDFVLKDQGYDFNSGVDRRTVAGGYKPTAESEMVWGKTVTFTPPEKGSDNVFGNLESNQGWVKNTEYGKTVTRDTSGDLLPRDLSQRISGAQVREDQINAGLLPAPFRSNGTTQTQVTPTSGIEKVSGLIPTIGLTETLAPSTTKDNGSGGFFGAVVGGVATVQKGVGSARDWVSNNDVFNPVNVVGGIGGVRSTAPVVSGYLDLYSKRVEEEKSSTVKPSDNVFVQSTNAATDATVGFIPGLFNVKFSPMADMNKAVGNSNDNPALKNAQTPKATADYINYGRSIDFKAESDYLNTRASQLETTRNANSKDGVWTGTQESYDTYTKDADLFKWQSDKFNANVNTQEGLFTKIGVANQVDVKSGAYVIRNGQYVENQDMQRPYGSFSDWSQGASRVLQGVTGNTKEQFAAQETMRNAADKSNPIVANPSYGIFGGYVAGEQQKFRNLDNAAFGFYKEAVTNPGGLVTSAYSGAQMYAVTMGAGGIIGSTAQGTGKAATVAKGIQAVGSNPIVEYGVPAVLIGKGAYDATGGFTLPASQASMNVGSSGAHLAAMGVGMGAFGATSGVVDYKYGSGEYQSIGKRFEAKPETRSVVTARMTNEIRPDITQPSGKVAEFTGEATITNSALPTYGGRTFPRLSNIKQVGTPTTEVLSGVGGSAGLKYDAGGFFEGRMAGSEIVPESGTRYYKMQIDSYKETALNKITGLGGDTRLARGSGNVKTFQQEYPNTLDSYIKAGESYSNQQARRGYADRLSPEEATLGYMSADASSIKLTSSQREMNVATVKQSTPRDISSVFDAFDWNAVKSGGTAHDMGRVTPFEYSQGLTFERTGGNARLEQKTIVERNAQSDTGLVTSDMTAKRKIVNRLQDESGAIVKGERETGYSFNAQTGELIADTIGTKGSVGFKPIRDASQSHIKSGGTTIEAHTHPGRTLKDTAVDVYDTITGKESGGLNRIISRIDYFRSGENVQKLPSHNTATSGDVIAFKSVPNSVELEFIVTRKGVASIDKPTEGWGAMGAIEYGIKSIRERRESGSMQPFSDYASELPPALKKIGAKYEYTPNTKAYRPSAETTTVKQGISQTMQNKLPSYMQKEIINLGDRQVLHNSLLEFERETLVAPSKQKTIGGRVGGSPTDFTDASFMSSPDGKSSNDRSGLGTRVYQKQELQFRQEPAVTSKRESVTAQTMGSGVLKREHLVETRSGSLPMFSSRQTLGVTQTPFSATERIGARASASASASKSDVAQRQERVTARESVSVYKREVVPRTDSIRAFVQGSTPYRASKQGRSSEGAVLFGVTPASASRYVQLVQPVQTPKAATITNVNPPPTIPYPIIPPPVIPPNKPITTTGGGFNWAGGSSSPAGGGQRGRRSSREVIGIRSSLEEFFGKNTSQLTKRRGRKF